MTYFSLSPEQTAVPPDSWIERVYEVEEVDPELEYIKADEEMDASEDWED